MAALYQCRELRAGDRAVAIFCFLRTFSYVYQAALVAIHAAQLVSSVPLSFFWFFSFFCVPFARYRQLPSEGLCRTLSVFRAYHKKKYIKKIQRLAFRLAQVAIRRSPCEKISPHALQAGGLLESGCRSTAQWVVTRRLVFLLGGGCISTSASMSTAAGLSQRLKSRS